MVASALFEYGIPWIGEILDDLKRYMDEMQFVSVGAFKGSMSQRHISDPTAYERANYIQMVDGKQWR